MNRLRASLFAGALAVASVGACSSRAQNSGFGLGDDAGTDLDGASFGDVGSLGDSTSRSDSGGPAKTSSPYPSATMMRRHA